MGTHSTAELFCSWMDSVNITLNSEAIRVLGSQPGSMKIETISDVDQGETLAKIPKDACITVHTTELTNVLAKEELAGGLGLVIAVWYEKGLGKASKWSGYFDSMKDREYLPIFWTSDELRNLQGTEVYGSVDTDRRDIEEDYEQHVKPLIQKYPEAFKNVVDTSVEAFMNAASLVASRAFAVDEEHGDGMVPLADVFNHKVSIVKLSDDYAIHGAEETSSSDGSYHSEEKEEPEEHTNGPSTVFPEPCAQDEDDLRMCGMTHANHLPLRLHIAIIDDSENDSLKIIAASPVERGREMFNTYGELGNAELVKKYGFCLPENPFTCVCLDKNHIFTALEKSMRQKRRKTQGKRNSFESIQQILLEQTMLADEGDDEPFHLHPNGYVNISILMYLSIMMHGLSGVDIDPIEEFLAAHEPEALDNPEPVRIDWVFSHIQESTDAAASKMIIQQFKDALIYAAEQRLTAYSAHSTKNELQASQILRDSEMTILRDFLRALP